MATAHANKREIITSNSASIGLQAGAIASTVAGAAVAAANHFSPTFRARLGVSGKVGLAVMAGVGAFAITSEQDLLRGSRNPDQYIQELHGQGRSHHDVEASQKRTLPAWQQAANFVHDHPFKTLACTAVPLVGLIFVDQSRNHNIQFSQKLMHTRIYGQGASVVLLLSTMAFYDHMSRRGPYQ
ncbi:Aste57867_408 [Aphanomyces stellatus]|uniref:Aste57867_408 protein n=1 Tax=Aphanomyces stellatus TaxID=120398 RepID=A0A485K6P0_9STRA|nr:hypothetical protein As57867_000407 [Aphanomyces stellatus]VFT77633.1 Aste57867_408 [Aphanomyces stellatus]